MEHENPHRENNEHQGKEDGATLTHENTRMIQHPPGTFQNDPREVASAGSQYSYLEALWGWHLYATLAFNTTMKSDTKIFVIPDHPFNASPYVSILGNLFFTWDGAMQIRVTASATALIGGILGFVNLPSFFTESQIQTMNQKQLFEFKPLLLDVNKDRSIEFACVDSRRMKYHMMGGLNTRDQDTFAGWIVCYVYSPLIQGSSGSSSIELKIETRGAYLYETLNPWFADGFDINLPGGGGGSGGGNPNTVNMARMETKLFNEGTGSSSVLTVALVPPANGLGPGVLNMPNFTSVNRFFIMDTTFPDGAFKDLADQLEKGDLTINNFKLITGNITTGGKSGLTVRARELINTMGSGYTSIGAISDGGDNRAMKATFDIVADSDGVKRLTYVDNSIDSTAYTDGITTGIYPNGDVTSYQNPGGYVKYFWKNGESPIVFLDTINNCFHTTTMEMVNTVRAFADVVLSTAECLMFKIFDTNSGAPLAYARMNPNGIFSMKLVAVNTVIGIGGLYDTTSWQYLGKHLLTDALPENSEAMDYYQKHVFRKNAEIDLEYDSDEPMSFVSRFRIMRPFTRKVLTHIVTFFPKELMVRNDYTLDLKMIAGSIC